MAYDLLSALTEQDRKIWLTFLHIDKLVLKGGHLREEQFVKCLDQMRTEDTKTGLLFSRESNYEDEKHN